MQFPVCLLLTKNNYTNWFSSCMLYFHFCKLGVESSWNVMAHGDAREGKWRGNWQMQWVASTLHTTSEHGVSSITTADAHTSAVPVVDLTDAPPADLNGLFRFARKTKSGFCACAITFQKQKKLCTSIVPERIQSRDLHQPTVYRNRCSYLKRGRSCITTMILSSSGLP